MLPVEARLMPQSVCLYRVNTELCIQIFVCSDQTCSVRRLVSASQGAESSWPVASREHVELYGLCQ